MRTDPAYRASDEDGGTAAPLTVRFSHVRPSIGLCEVEGEVDVATAPWLRSQLHAALGHRPAHLIVDMCGITFFSAAGLRVLRETSEECAGPRLALVERDGPVSHVLTMCGASALFPQFRDLGGAVRAWDARQDTLR
ncbi:MAG TPA: STAS domain-containing protein [Pseudonocardia sp.]